MAETIESFVSKLQKDGVEAGRQEAEKIKAEASQAAEKLLADAKKQAEQIVADAEKQAKSLQDRSRTELELAARDIVLKLRDALGRAIGAVLAAGAGQKLQDVEFLGSMLHDLILKYAEADIEHGGRIQIDVPEEIRQKLVDWALREMGQDKLEGLKISLDLKGTLAQAGFEYNLTGATVEVTLESVVEMLTKMVSPAMRELLDRAMASGDDK
ncbi:MAG TPA: hypothetical protein PLS90_17055 [Candidatus Sumerlaeota bacterium]|nr:hypothetical protein [Candidatus Sumerlaeota bacterium]